MKIVCIKMRYSIEPRNKIYVNGYGFLSFAKNKGKSLSNKYGQKLLDSAKKFDDLIGNKIAYKVTSVSKKKTDKELHNNDDETEDVEIITSKKR